MLEIFLVCYEIIQQTEANKSAHVLAYEITVSWAMFTV